MCSSLPNIPQQQSIYWSLQLLNTSLCTVPVLHQPGSDYHAEALRLFHGIHGLNVPSLCVCVSVGGYFLVLFLAQLSVVAS